MMGAAGGSQNMSLHRP